MNPFVKGHKTKKEKEIESYLIYKQHITSSDISSKTNDSLLNTKRERDETKLTNKTDALNKILKHLDKQNNILKCLKLLHLLFKNLEDINPELMLSTFQKLSSLENIFNAKDHRSELAILYTATLTTISTQPEEYFTPEQQKTFSLYNSTFKLQCDLHSDDTFIFNQALKQIEKQFNTLPDYTKSESELIKLERQLMFNCITLLSLIPTQIWAVATVNQFYSKMIINKLKLTEEQIETLEAIINKTNTETRINTTKDATQRRCDDKIRETPLNSYHKVVDGREDCCVEFR